jgi:DNA-binding transcriptional LysR family regulator
MPCYRIVRRRFPHVKIVTVDPRLDEAQQMMMRGQIDLAIGMFSGLDGEFHQQRLFEKNYVALFRSDHPSIDGPLTSAQFLDADHLIYTPTAGSHAKFEAALDAIFKQYGKTRSVAMQVAHSVSLDRIVAASNMVACIPSRLAQTLSVRKDVRSCALPFDIQPMDIVQLWHAQFHCDDGHRWLRTGLRTFSRRATRRFAVISRQAVIARSLPSLKLGLDSVCPD